MRSLAKSDRVGAVPEFSVRRIHLATQRNRQASSLAENSRTRHIASPVTARAATEAQEEAPSLMIHFLRWSAIKDCAPLSSPDEPIWERRTGAETYPASRCRIRTSPT